MKVCVILEVERSLEKLEELGGIMSLWSEFGGCVKYLG